MLISVENEKKIKIKKRIFLKIKNDEKVSFF